MEVRDQELCRDKVHSLEWSPSCPLDYHKTWDQLKRKCHKESLWAVSVMYDIYIETHHQERKERPGWPELPAGVLPACGPWQRH